MCKAKDVLNILEQWFSNFFFAMETFDIMGNIAEPLLKLNLNKIEEMLYLTKLMS